MVSDPGELPDRCGIVFATKGPQLAGCVATVAGGLARAGRSARWVAGLQNGVIKDGTLAAGFGTERVLRTTSTLNARAESPLRVDVTGFGHTYVGATGAGRLLLDPAQRALAGALPLSSIHPRPADPAGHLRARRRGDWCHLSAWHDQQKPNRSLCVSVHSPVRIGVIGCGRIAQVAHLPAIAKAETVSLAALSDPSPALAKGMAARYGVPAFTATEELLAEDLDAVLIAVPDRLHLPVAEQAIAAGKHILVEKPAAETSEQASRLAALAAARALKVQVGAMRRHDPGIQYARRAVAELGPLLSVSGWYRVHARLRPPTEQALFPATVVDEDTRRGETAFKADRRRYLLATHGAHVFDELRYLAGDVTTVRAQLAHVGADFSWQGTGRIAGGALASFEVCANVHSDYSEGFEIYGARGHVSIRSYFPFFRRPSAVRVFLEEDTTWRSPEFGASDAYQRQVEAFAAAVRDGTGTDPSAEDGVQALRLIEAVAASAAEDGAEVAL